MMNRRTNTALMAGQMHRKIILLSHTLTMRGSDVASLVEFCPVVLVEMWSVTNR